MLCLCGSAGRWDCMYSVFSSLSRYFALGKPGLGSLNLGLFAFVSLSANCFCAGARGILGLGTWRRPNSNNPVVSDPSVVQWASGIFSEVAIGASKMRLGTCGKETELKTHSTQHSGMHVHAHAHTRTHTHTPLVPVMQLERC